GVIAGGNPARVIRPRPGFALPIEKAIEVPPASDDVHEHRALLIADFIINELASHLAPDIDSVVAPFDQVVQTLMNLPAHGCDAAVVWTRPERAVPAFGEKARGANVSIEAIVADVDAFAERIARAAPDIRFVVVPSWALPPSQRGLGMIDMKD